jgi:PilZ domain
MATQDLITKAHNGAPSTHRTLTQTERRSSRRCKITQLMRIRPSDPEKDHFDDLRGTLSVSRSGVYFQTIEKGYEIGMRLFVTMPYSHDAHSMSREYLAEVVRVDALENGMNGIGFKILMEIGMTASPFSSHAPRK